MATKKKLLEAAAGSAGGGGLNIEDVFSTYLYETASSVAVNNGIDLSGEGGLVWIKTRDIADNHFLNDTARGTGKALSSDLNSAESTTAYKTVSSFNSNGYTAKGHGYGSSKPLVSWTFRKAPKFFDVVTYTGNGTTNRQISHNLGSAPGCIIVKRTNGLKDWAVYHRGKGNTHYGTLNTTEAFYDAATWWQDTDPTSTNFTVGNSAFVNANGDTYVAYLFAHNDGDGEFGPDGDADIIKCGSYTGTATTGSPTINLGFEPQFVLVKRTDSTGNWIIQDNMRSVNTTSTDMLFPNLTNAATTGSYATIVPTATGFYIGDNGTNYNASGGTYIYIAIRRGPMAVPESATDVFDISHATDANDASFPVDFMLTKIMAGGNGYARDRLRGGTKYLLTDGTFADLSGTDIEFDDMTGTGLTGWGTGYIHYNWKRAPNYFDVVAYEGNSTAGRTVSHNLGVAPEMMWVKRRNSAAFWAVYHKDLGNTDYIALNTDGASATSSVFWNNTSPTSTDFTLGTYSAVNGNADTFIAYLFATVDGVSKVGSYTGTGTSLNIDCGFSSGARFVLIKRTDSTGSWWVFDTERGLVAGADAAISLNSTAAQFSTVDYIDPYSAGFNLTGIGGDINASGGSYIFYAIA